jgi:hypothetical protein
VVPELVPVAQDLALVVLVLVAEQQRITVNALRIQVRLPRQVHSLPNLSSRRLRLRE